MLDLYLKGGALMHPLLAASVIALAITLDRLWYFWTLRSKELGRQFERIEKLLSNGKRKEAGTIAASIAGPIGKILQVGLDPAEEEPEIIEERMAIHGEAMAREASKGLSLLALIPPVSTLLGLLGTVLGMVLSFQRLALIEGAASPALLASGIWVALITTVAGMAVAIPALIAHHYLQSQKERLIFEIEHYGSRLLLQLKKMRSLSGHQDPSRDKIEKGDFESEPFRFAIEKGLR